MTGLLLFLPFRGRRACAHYDGPGAKGGPGHTFLLVVLLMTNVNARVTYLIPFPGKYDWSHGGPLRLVVGACMLSCIA